MCTLPSRRDVASSLRGLHRNPPFPPAPRTEATPYDRPAHENLAAVHTLRVCHAGRDPLVRIPRAYDYILIPANWPESPLDLQSNARNAHFCTRSWLLGVALTAMGQSWLYTCLYLRNFEKVQQHRNIRNHPAATVGIAVRKHATAAWELYAARESALVALAMKQRREARARPRHLKE